MLFLFLHNTIFFEKGEVVLDHKQYAGYHEEIDHTPADFPYNVYLCTIPLDFPSVKTHWHEEIEIIVIKKGEGIVSVDLTDYKVCAGDAVFVFSGQLHSVSQKADCTMEYENILFKPALLRSAGQDPCSDRFLQPLCSGSLRAVPVLHDARLTELIAQADQLCDARPRGYQLAVKGLLFQMMYQFLSSCGQFPEERSDRRPLEKIKTVLSYVEQHYQEPITIEEIAGQCFYSKSYFMKFFKEMMGMGFIAYLNEYRLEAASRILLTSQGTILDAAMQSGFENLSYFTRSFKKKYGMTPGQYRKQRG